MKIKDLSGKNILILGYGREGKATAEALEKHAPSCIITIGDQNENLQTTNYKLQTGPHWLKNLEQFDFIIKSPGIPPNSSLKSQVSKITNATQLFLDSIPQETLVIGVTGSKGKSTTSSVIHAILKQAGKETILVGNIGDAAISHIEEVSPQTIVVMEMSSYQLMDINRSPQIAVVTNFFPEHLDYHGSLEAYKEAKATITKHQTPNDTVIFYEHSEGAKEIADGSKGKKIAYTEEDSPIAIIDTNLIGVHNLCNIAGAATVARLLDVEDSIIIEAVREFKGLPHRMQDIGIHHGIRWIDDAISTTPDSTIEAIKALTPNVHTLIAGGKDRGSDFTQLAEVIASCNVKHVVLMGENAKHIAQTLKDTSLQVDLVTTMEEAIQQTRDLRLEKDSCLMSHVSCPIILLSPASPSYDTYTNFEQKGEAFKNAILSSSSPDQQSPSLGE